MKYARHHYSKEALINSTVRGEPFGFAQESLVEP